MGFVGKSVSYLLFSILHFIQFVLAITVIGLYATDLDRAHKKGVYADGKWVYAVVVGSLSAVTAALYSIPLVLRSVAVPIWSFVLFVLWIALFGVFASLYLHERPEGNGDIQRMKNAMWIDLVNALLWLIGSSAAFIYWFLHRERNTRFTGRARV
ncbi:hypothetical protein F4678DRAFT_280676 [Xylaria arbuscula]|nr:hypothetical protein F4678DRAFT_280676 [Xylaria arbuscula]